jgi:hypothetical protein
MMVFSSTEVAPKNPITCTICVDLIELADEAILSNSTIEQVSYPTRHST